MAANSRSSWMSQVANLQLTMQLFKGAQLQLNGLKSLAKLFKFVVCNPCQSSPSLTILVPSRFIIISLLFFYLYKVLFSGFHQFNGTVILSMLKITQNTVIEPL